MSVSPRESIGSRRIGRPRSGSTPKAASADAVSFPITMKTRSIALLLFAVWLLTVHSAPVWAGGEAYGPTRRGDTPWTIASKVYRGETVTRDQAILALLRANPEAFGAPCNANSPLQAGAILEVPPLADALALSADAAQREVQRQEEEWTKHRRTGAPLVCPPVSPTPAVATSVPQAETGVTPSQPAAQMPAATMPPPVPALVHPRTAASAPSAPSQAGPAPARPGAAAPTPTPAAPSRAAPPSAQPPTPAPAPAGSTDAAPSSVPTPPREKPVEPSEPTETEPVPPSTFPRASRPAEHPGAAAARVPVADWRHLWREIEPELAEHRWLVWLGISALLALAAGVLFHMHRKGRKERQAAPEEEAVPTAEPAAQTGGDFDVLSVDEAIQRLRTDADRGLDREEASRRLQEYGPNEIKEHEESLWHRIFRRFWGPIPWMIEAAALLSGIVQKWDDLVIILIMLLVNAGLDFFQEHRALNALAALKASLAKAVIALRDGAFATIMARDLVPGDIVKLKIGDIVPADVKLLKGDYLSIDQAALTGESLPVSKKSGDVAYANTIVKQGEMLAVVVSTGARTAFAKVVQLVAKASLKERSHFQRMVIQIGNFLILVTLALVALIIMVAIFRHESLLEIARFSLVLTVAAIPVALPAVLSVTMAVGAVNLARRQAIVSRLSAIEELAGVDVFCSDKTGTLTQNRMEVAEPVVLEGFDAQDLFQAAALASSRENDDPMEVPIFRYLEQQFPQLDLSRYHQRRFVPFDPVRKRTEAVIEGEGETFTVIKGAAQVLLDMTDLPDQRTEEIEAEVDRLAGRGYRTLAVGRRRGDAPLELIGLIPLYDPPRDDSAEVLRKMRDDGVRVKMVTGDHVAIAREVGRLLGLEQETILARQLKGSGSQALLSLAEALTTAIYRRLEGDASLREAERFAAEVMESLDELYDTRLLDREFIHTHESAIVEMIEAVDIFAEVVPEDKYRIVDTLQKGGHIVGMTGDGVNDAPALKKADCGFAVDSATDAARAAADIVLTAPGLSVINDAIEQARITFERMQSYAIFRIAETIRIILFMTLSIVIFSFYPITALMIILLALLNDIPILAIAYDRTRVERRPVRWNMYELTALATVLGVMGVIASFLLFYLLQEWGFSHDEIRTFLFLKLIVAGHSTLYVTRARGWFWQKPWPAPVLFGATFFTEIVGTIFAAEGWLMTPIGWEAALWIWAYALAWFLINDVVKVMAARLIRQAGNHVDRPERGSRTLAMSRSC